MSYEIEYSDLASPETIQKALDDCKDWLGKARFKKVCGALAEDRGRSNPGSIRMGLMMVGIQGYPAKVLIDTYLTRQRDLFD